MLVFPVEEGKVVSITGVRFCIFHGASKEAPCKTRFGGNGQSISSVFLKCE